MIKVEPLHLESHNDWRLIPLVMETPSISKEHQREIGKIKQLLTVYYYKATAGLIQQMERK